MPLLPKVFPAPPLTDQSAVSLLDAANSVAGILLASHHNVFFAGGFVRDLILHRKVHDIDIATEAHPEEVMTLFPGSRSFGKSFGVVQVDQNDFHFEVATFRKDLEYRDGRHPVGVIYSTPEEDALRRDFTMNGLFYDPANRTIVDFVNGTIDLEHKTIRAIGTPDARFAEDHLRIMRAVRFSAVLGFVIEPQTWSSMIAAVHSLSSISIERIRDEFMRTMMEAQHPGDALELFLEAGILRVIFPELTALVGVMQPPEFHPEGDVFTHVKIMLNNMSVRSPELIWSILLHDIAKPATFAVGSDKAGRPRIQFRGHAELGAQMGVDIMRRFKCSNEEIDVVHSAVLNHMRFSAVPEMRNSTLRKWVGAPTFPLELELHRIDCTASSGKLDHYQFVKEFQSQLQDEPSLPAPLIKGNDLMVIGIPPGPMMGKLLRLIYDKQLENEFTDREQAELWLNQNIDRLRAKILHAPQSPDVDK